MTYKFNYTIIIITNISRKEETIMEEVTLKEILNVVLDVKQELKELKQETNQKFEEMNERITALEERQNTMQKQIDQILREEVDTRDIVKIIVDKIGEIDRKIDALAKDKCIFHKTLVGAKG